MYGYNHILQPLKQKALHSAWQIHKDGYLINQEESTSILKLMIFAGPDKYIES